MKNIRLYPAGHDLVKTRTKAAYQLLSKLLAKNKTLLFGVARDTITFGEKNLGVDSPSCSAFAKALSRNEIASLTFEQGVSQHSLYLFLKAVGVLPEHRSNEKTLEQELAALNIPHIGIVTVNYMDFDRVQGSTGHGDDNGLAGEKTDSATWLEFATRITHGTFGQPGAVSESSGGRVSPGPEALATAINANAHKQPDIAQQFSFYLDQMLQQKNPSQASMSGGELSTVLTSLNPQIRDQFLRATLQKCDQNREQNNPEKLLRGFSHNLIKDMLQLITEKDAAVSPSLLNLIHNLSRIHSTAPKTPTPSAMDSEKMSSLLAPEKYDQYVSREYQQTLQHLSGPRPSEHASPPDFPLEQHLLTMEDTHLTRQIIRATLFFMEATKEAQDYRELANRLMEFTRQLPEAGEFDLLLKIAKVLKRHTVKKESTAIIEIAANSFAELTEEEFLDYVYSALLEAANAEERQKAILFFLFFGADILDKLIQIFCMQQTVDEDNLLLPVFNTFRVQTLTAIFTILPKVNEARAKKLLLLVQYLGARGTAPLLHPLLAHDNPEIQLQVLNILLPLNDKKSFDTVEAMLSSKNDMQIETAIDLCNKHKLMESVPALLNLLDYQVIKESAIARNRTLILTLGRIGDKRALPALEKIAFSKWPFHRKLVRNMKQILFYSLKGYQHADRINLVKKGLQLKDEEIRKICNTLLPPQQRAKTGI